MSYYIDRPSSESNDTLFLSYIWNSVVTSIHSCYVKLLCKSREFGQKRLVGWRLQGYAIRSDISIVYLAASELCIMWIGWSPVSRAGAWLTLHYKAAPDCIANTLNNDVEDVCGSDILGIVERDIPNAGTNVETPLNFRWHFGKSVSVRSPRSNRAQLVPLYRRSFNGNKAMFLPDCAVNVLQWACVDILLFKAFEAQSMWMVTTVKSTHSICSESRACQYPGSRSELITLKNPLQHASQSLCIGVPNLDLIRWFLTELFARHSRDHPWLLHQEIAGDSETPRPERAYE